MNLSGLPTMEYSFHVSLKGSNTGEMYEGDFVYKRPNYAQKVESARLTAKLNGDLETLDPAIKFMNAVLGHLRYTLTEFPKWWENNKFGLELYDDNVIVGIFELTNEFEEKWHESVWGKEPEKPEEGTVKDESKGEE